MHVYNAETDSKARGKWLNSLNKIRELKPSVVIPGHSKVGAPLDASTAVDFTENYLVPISKPEDVKCCTNKELEHDVRTARWDTLSGCALLGIIR
jgi:hypothetical protein